jgi:hypothetical protein
LEERGGINEVIQRKGRKVGIAVCNQAIGSRKTDLTLTLVLVLVLVLVLEQRELE